MMVMLLVLGAAWLAFTQGCCFMAGAKFESTYKRAYIWNLNLNILLIAAVIFVMITLPKIKPTIIYAAPFALGSVAVPAAAGSLSMHGAVTLAGEFHCR